MSTVSLAHFEAVVDDAAVAPRIEARLPVGVRPRQLSVRTLVVGMLLALADGRPAHLSRVHGALAGLGVADRRRLGVVVDWNSGPHDLTYRQIERTFSLVVAVLAQDTPDGTPSTVLAELADSLVEASVPGRDKDTTSSYGVDWTDLETFARPVAKGETGGADPEASWGHRRPNVPGKAHELFFGYYVQPLTMVNDDTGPPVPELARRVLVTSCHVDPVPQVTGVFGTMVDSGVRVGDVLADSGYSHRVPEHWALPMRAMGADLVVDLHPHDRGTQGTHQGAIAYNGNLYCPSTPPALFGLEPLARGASDEQVTAHDARAAELAHYKLGRISGDDADGYHRVMCPAAMGKVRCPLRPRSMEHSHTRPEILDVPEHRPACCTQVTLTIGPTVNAKTAQKHDYPSKAHRLSYGRRSASERTNATVKDPATTDIARGWCRVMGLSAITLFIVCAFVVRNQRVVESFEQRQRDNERRMAQGLAPRSRKRRRTTITDLVGAANAPP